MIRRISLLAAVTAAMLGASIPAAGASSIPSGERVVGQSTVEPVYNDEQAGTIGFAETPMNAPKPVNANSQSWAPFYEPIYPVGSTVGTLLCQHLPVDNCPDHGPQLAAAAAAIEPSVYGSGVLGHDHLISFPGGSDFNVAWEPVLVLFTSKAAANEHLLTVAQIDAAVARGDAIEIPGPAHTFDCAVVPASVYALGTPLS
jgi:hypothetical protein